MDTELLKTFLAVDRTGQFGKAAESLYLTPAAVSARIRQLEGMVGTPLFNRQRNNVTLTPAGERLKPHAEAILETWNLALEDTSFAPGHAQEFTIGGSPNTWDFLLPDFLEQLHARWPEVSLRAESQGSDRITALLQARRLDMAVMLEPLKLEETRREVISEIELVLVATDKGLAMADALGERYIHVDWNTAFTLQYQKLVRGRERPVLSTSSGQIALGMLSRRGGAAFLPRRTVRAALDDGSLQLVDEAPVISLPLHAVWREDSRKLPQVQEVTALLSELN